MSVKQEHMAFLLACEYQKGVEYSPLISEDYVMNCVTV
jgi:hypothetical protein